MAWLFPLLMVGIVVVALAMLQAEGLWGNILNLLNTVLAGLITMNFWEPLADLAEEQLPRFTYFYDFVVMWVLFIVSAFVLRAISSKLSKVRVRFRKPVELVGNYILALLTGWVMMCFTLTTLHAAPVGVKSFFGGFNPEERMVYGTAPDRTWLNFTQGMSLRGLANGANEAHVFDPDARYIAKYGLRRLGVEAASSLTSAASE